MTTRHTGTLGLAALALLAGAAGAADYPGFAGQDAGRSLWLENCEGCHGYGTAGAPVPMQPADWTPRLGKPLAVLYEHALNGFFGPDDTMMPARGGNDALTDDQVRAAVDYMIRLARHHGAGATTDSPITP